MQLLLEVAVFNMESARIAANAGADRIELCSALVAGGLTPSVEMMMQANEELRCPFFVMIRPKPGGFMYSVAEISQMKEDILMAKAHGASGFVFGILKQDGTIDEAANAALLAIAYPLPCTFHRAFDTIENKQAALETLIWCGFQRVLTSGGMGNAADYSGQLQQLISQAKERIIVMPGGGIRGNNIQWIKAMTGAREYHSAAITGKRSFADAAEISRMKLMLAAC